MSKKGIISGYLVFVVIVIFVYFSFQNGESINKEAVSEIFVIQKGEGLKEISEKLKQEGLVDNSKLFQIYTFLSNARSRLLPGEFNLEQGMGFKDLIKILTSRPLAPETTVTLIEGLTNLEIASLLEQQDLVTQSDFFMALEEISKDEEFLKKYEFLTDISQDFSAEEKFQGYLFPDTYRFYQETDAKAVVEKMIDNFDQKLTNEMREQIKKGGHNIHEVITLASIVEKEVHLDQDRRLVANIFWNRLLINWALQSDATINYILNTSKLQPTFKDTRVPSPYNTYLNPGLPPGPINNPSLSSINAVINPIENDYCCFLTAPEGQNIFSKTIQEHNRNKDIYLK